MQNYFFSASENVPKNFIFPLETNYIIDKLCINIPEDRNSPWNILNGVFNNDKTWIADDWWPLDTSF